MSKARPSTLEMQELGLNLVALNFQPSMLNLDVLRFSGIFPEAWELAQEPIATPELLQLNFTNGVNFLAQPRQISFLQGTQTSPNTTQLDIPELAQQYLRQFPNTDYQGLSVAPKVLVGFPEQPELAQKFITQQLLNRGGAWQNLGQGALKATVTLNYQLKRCPLTIAINEVILQHQEQQITALLFAGAFNYTIPEQYRDRRLAYMSKCIEQWSTDLTQFSEVVHRKFLSLAAPQNLPPVFPELDRN